MFMPKFSNYGRYKSDNYGSHTLRFDVGGFTFWYSYQTLVAFQAPNHNRVVRQNDWGPTTGKHLTMIDGGRKNERVDSVTFEAKLEELVAPFFDGVAA